MNTTNNQNLTTVNNQLYSAIFFGLGLGVIIACYFIACLNYYFEFFTYLELPKLILNAGIATLISAVVFGYFLKRYAVSYLSTICLVTIGAFSYYLFYEFSFAQDTKTVAKWAFISFFPLSQIAYSLYQTYRHALFDIRENKKLETRISLGIVAAFALTALSLHPLLQRSFLELRHLFFFSALASILSLIINWVSAINYNQLHELQLSAQYINYKYKFKNIIRDKYFLLLSTFSLFSTISIWLFDVLFLYATEQSGKTNQDLFTFISLCILSFIIIAYILLWVSKSKLIRQYGIKTSLLILPILCAFLLMIGITVAYFYGFEKNSTSFIRFFIIIIAGTVLVSAIKYGFQQTLFKQYFSPIETALRFNAETIIQNVVRSIALIIVGLSLSTIFWLNEKAAVQSFLTEINQPGFPIFLILLCLVFTIGWTISIYYMYRMYKDLLEDNLGQQSTLIKHDQSLTISLIHQLLANIPQDDYRKSLFQLNLLKIIDPTSYRNILVELADHQDESIQEYAMQDIMRYYLLGALVGIQKVLQWKYFSALKAARLIKEVHERLNESLTRIEKVKYVDQLTSSKLLNERVYGALLAQHLDPSEKSKVLTRLFGDKNQQVIYHAILASQEAEDSNLHNQLILQLNDPNFSNAVVSVISASGDVFINMLETAFQLSKSDQRTQQRIVQIYGRISTEKAVNLLLNKLNYPNQNVVSSSLDALSRCGFTVTDSNKALQVRTELKEVCNAMIWNMSVYLDASNCHCSKPLLQALEYEITGNYETLFRLLALIYDPKTVELVKTNINSRNVEESEFAADLMDIFINDEMKSFLIPIFRISSYKTKVEDLMNTFPTEPMEKTEMLINLVQRDYKWINSWTKTCALKQLSEEGKKNSFDLMASHLVNPDPILRETAAESLMEHFPDEFEQMAIRYQKQKEFYYAYETTQVVKGIRAHRDLEVPALKYDMITFLNQVHEFKGISGLVLSEIIKNTKVVKYEAKELIHTGKLEDLDYYFVFRGSLNMSTRLRTLSYNAYDMIHPLYLNAHDHSPVSLKAESDCTLIKIEKAVFHELLSFYEEIAQSMLNQFEVEKEATDIENIHS